jgi:catechol 2,3-dioxygenase-like lactoylglutathione lyase family enzyme
MRQLLTKEIASMTKFNHVNLSVSNVPALTRFFEESFGFHLAEQRGTGKLSVLLGDDGFVLTLMHDKNVTSATYPPLFHVGFLVDSMDTVRERYARIVEAGYEAPAPAILKRGGPKSYGFYCHAPGGIMVEVSARAA